MSSIISTAAPAAEADQTGLQARALTLLREALAKEQGWVRVHAAETLIAVGDGAHARAAYLRELPALEAGPQRVGAWRVLAATASTPPERARYVAKIEAAFLAEGAPDRLQAIESLCKLKVPVSGDARQRVRAMRDGLEAERPLANWALQVGGDGAAIGRIAQLLTSTDPVVRLRAAYALRWLKPNDRAILTALTEALKREPAGSQAQPYLLSAALALRAAPEFDAAWLQGANELVAAGPTGARYELCQALVQRSEPGDPRNYLPLFDHADGDVRIGAAWRVLDLTRR